MSQGRPSLLGVAIATGATLLVVVGLTLATGVDWFYPRPLTTIAVMVAVLLATLIVRRLLPTRWRPSGAAAILVAGVAGYVFLRIAVSAQWTEFVDHELLETFEGEIDDVPTWAFAGVAAAAVFVFVALVSRWVGGRSGDDAAS